jgi:hypothetical protein
MLDWRGTLGAVLVKVLGHGEAREETPKPEGPQVDGRSMADQESIYVPSPYWKR